MRTFCLVLQGEVALGPKRGISWIVNNEIEDYVCLFVS